MLGHDLTVPHDPLRAKSAPLPGHQSRPSSTLRTASSEVAEIAEIAEIAECLQRL